jgi:choline dehydrogenase-like flavoprotein
MITLMITQWREAADGLVTLSSAPSSGHRGLGGVARRSAENAHRPVGSCSIGVDHMLMVDERLKTCGVDSYYAVDTSIMGSSRSLTRRQIAC